MRFLLILSLLLPVCGQNVDPRAAIIEKRRAEQPEVFALAELSLQAPPEFGAWGLLYLLDAGAVRDKDWQLELALEAHRLALLARHPLRQRLAPGLPVVNGRAMLWASAYNRGLDRLTLTMRAIDRVKALDAIQASDLFYRFPRPQARQSSCKDALLDDLAPWYLTAGHFRLELSAALAIIGAVETPGELPPVIALILEQGRNAEEMAALFGALSSKLRSLPAGERAFTSALPQVSSLLTQLPPSPMLQQGWAAWLTNNLAVNVCQESTLAGFQDTSRRQGFAAYQAKYPDAPLAAELLQAKPGGEAADMGALAPNADATEQAARFRELLFGEGSAGLNEAQKRTPEWREKFVKFLQQIENMRAADGESASELFHRKAQAWAGVIVVSLPGEERDRALAQYLSHLLTSAGQVDPLVWFMELEGTAELTRSLHGQDYAKLLRAMEQTGHPVMVLYARLQTLLPSRPAVR